LRNAVGAILLPKAVILLVGNKNDLADDRALSDTEVQEWAKRYGLEYLETSVKTGNYVTDPFVRLGQGILRKHKVIPEPVEETGQASAC
jgi:GTPase SAR1 family protein